MNNAFKEPSVVTFHTMKINNEKRMLPENPVLLVLNNQEREKKMTHHS